MSRNKSWIVSARVERYVTVYVTARTEAEALAKAKAWDIDGDEEPGETLDWHIADVRENT